ncbi:glycosyltransferase [Flavobacterium sp. J27]|uniref:glycosyltransferase n=1 Tax=Flavobacterium sp. J27 TaxID=2060419 RepID=UPI00197AACD7|nr:glycosyltransferase [Flavobacterium sp. J27]
MMNLRSENDIIKNWTITENNLPFVSIVCHTFNQEKFIEQAIISFLNQKTTFSFEVIIHDDASTDQTVSIIKSYQQKYPSIIKLILQDENKYSKRISIWTNFTFPACKGKYIALCEGDDYWTDVEKLQKQVDFLESNQKYVICWTDYLNFNGSTFQKNEFGFNEDVVTIDFNTIFNPYCTYSLTTVFLKSALDLPLLSSLKRMKDNSLYCLLLKEGLGAFLNYKTAVYRIHEGGVYSLKSLYFQRYSSYLNLKEIYDVLPESHTKNIEKTLQTLLRNAAFEALKIKYTSNEATEEQEGLLTSYFPKATFSVKLKYYKRILQYRFLKKK